MKNWLLIPAGIAALAVASLSATARAEDNPPAGNGKPPAGPEQQLAIQARDLLKRYCYECHGTKQEAEDFNVAIYRTVIAAKNKYIVPKNPDDSAAWQAMGVAKRMPPEGHPQPTDAERAVIKEWIDKGAIEWPVLIDPRPFVSDLDVLTAMRDDLRSAQAVDRPFLRYFSVANLHNNWTLERVGKSVPIEADVVNLARAALSKACNSMTWENRIVVPKAVDKNGCVLRIDLRDLGWDKNQQWVRMLRLYPYGLGLHLSRDQATRQIAEEVYELAGTQIPCLRVDWFVDTATRPPLYHDILALPAQISELEKTLRVDVESDFQRERLARAGFAESGVSRSNRLVDRHVSAYGYYWKSYDFAKSDGEGNLFRFPLGPEFPKNDYNRQAFKHDGGEMIFSLPNGMQAYYLSTAKGDRINEGPPEIVRDPNEFSGTIKVVNGLSCMGCHAYGMRRFTDTIRDGLAVEGNARLKVDRLFPKEEAMKELVLQDEEKFLQATVRATAAFLNPADASSVTTKMMRNYKEPVGTLCKMYQKDLSLEEAAYELGLQNANDLKVLINANTRLRQLGLGPLVNGAAIKREAWSSMQGLSTFHKIALELDRGTPLREF